MKIKLDFVTNSSSTMFIIASANKILRKDIEKYFNLQYGESVRCFSTKHSLINFTESKFDWISKARGVPRDYYNMNQYCYDAACKVLSEGKFVLYAVINRNNLDRHDKFVRIVEEHSGDVFLITGD